MERCPCCNARLTGAVTCPRCQADLASVLGSEQRARHWLDQAMQFWFANEAGLAILALSKSVALKHTPSGLVFRDFIVQQQCRKAIALLTDKKYYTAEKLLGQLLDLHPGHEFARQLYGFTEHLLAKEIIAVSTRQIIQVIDEIKSR
jgi:hypothetical protein